MPLPPLALVASGILIAGFVVVVAAASDLTWVRFKTPVLRNKKDLARFRRAICRQRWASLLVILLLVAAGGVALVGFIGGWVRSEDLPFAIGAGIPLMVVEWWMKHAERRFKEVPTANETIAVKWHRTLEEWEQSPIPDWG
jgi:heme A synthase